MGQESKIRKKALIAIKAVTAGAVLFAGVACSGEEEANDVGFNITEADAATGDTEGDTTPVADADSGAECNSEESTGVCPEMCDRDNDVDCCNDDGMYEWWDGGCHAMAVPGPFVPPKMRA